MMKKRTFSLMLAGLMLIGTLSACGNEPEVAETQAVETPAVETPAPEPETRVVTDMNGTDVTVPMEITNYFNAYPVSNGVMVLLGTQEAQNYYLERVTSPNWAWLREFNPLIMQKTIIGDDATATAEEVLNTDAQVVILSNKDTAATYREAGINVFSVSAGNTLEGFRESVRKTAELFGGDAVNRAEQYIAYSEDVLAMVTERVSAVPQEEWPTVYYIGGKTPYSSRGGGDFREEYINAGGGLLSTADIVENGDITAEQLLELDPDYILVGTNNRAVGYEALMTDPALTGLSALKNGTVFQTPQGTLPWDTLGPEVAMMPAFVGKTLHPELFEDIDLKTMMKEFYQDFYDYELSDEYADLMLVGAMGPDAS